MITFFTTAKPFEGHSGIIQRNALRSWKLLHADVEVIVFGDDEGAAGICSELGLRHEPKVQRHESGMKYLDCMFDKAQQIARHDFVCYSNCDIVLMNDFWRAFERARGWSESFLMVAQRWDTNVTEPLDFGHEDWARNLFQHAITTGYLQDQQCIDFFLFRRGLYDRVPPLVVGRSYWDHWLVWKALSRGTPVLDASAAVVPVHQNHSYGYHPKGKQGTNEDELAKMNFQLSGNGKYLRCILDSTYQLTSGGKIRRSRFRRSVAKLRLWEFRQHIVTRTFGARRRLGLRRVTLNKLFGIPPRTLD